MKLTLGIHTGSSTFTLGNASAVPNIIAVTAQSQSGCLPFMMSACEAGVELATSTTASICTLYGGIGTANGVDSLFGKQCYYNACMYKFTPSYEKLYLEQSPQKEIVYTDVYQKH